MAVFGGNNKKKNVMVKDLEDDVEQSVGSSPIPPNKQSLLNRRRPGEVKNPNKKQLKADVILSEGERMVEEESVRIISDADLAFIRNDISSRNSVLMMEAMSDDKAKDELQEIVKTKYKAKFNNDYDADENADYIVDELVGTGLIERLINEDDTITDIEWDGDHLTVVSNDAIIIKNGEDLHITEDYVKRLIQKFVVVNKTDFNMNQALFNGMYGNMRMSATHATTSPYGTTFSLRISKSRLALNESNWSGFAPQFILEWFRTLIRSRINIVIAGETGAGKTELQKFLLGLADKKEKFYVIEDVMESHLKELYPDRRIFSTLTTAKYSISDHVKQALRNNPEWIVVAETRSSEAYEMLQAVLSGHNIITTVHAIDARAIPHRFMNMCLSGYDVSEKMLQEDIYRYFDLGIHIKKAKKGDTTYRYLSEMVEYNADGTATTLFRQVFDNGNFVIKEVGAFSRAIHERIAEKGLKLYDGSAMKTMLAENNYTGYPDGMSSKEVV